MSLMQQSIETSGCDMVTVAVRRVQTVAAGHAGLMEAIDWSRIWMLPNTAGCSNAEEAIRVARLGRELAKLAGQEENNFVKLEVIPDSRHLLPDPIGTLEAAEQLVKEGFTVLPYINADPLLAKRLEDAGCATVMPLGSPIGSGQGLNNAANIALIVENASVPVVVDAGIGVPSEAAPGHGDGRRCCAGEQRHRLGRRSSGHGSGHGSGGHRRSDRLPLGTAAKTGRCIRQLPDPGGGEVIKRDEEI